MTFIGLEMIVLESLFTLCKYGKNMDRSPLIPFLCVASLFSTTWHYLAFESSENSSKILFAFYYQDGLPESQ